MKAYLLITSTIFGLITGAHVLRLYFEPHVATEIPFNLLTLLSAGLWIWGICLLRRPSK
jgi:multisubunit Na+/H+ antiporter MnhE subunit